MGETTKILIVEDERIIAKGIEICLKRLGYQVAGSVGCGEEAVPLARICEPDLVLLDINLGGGIDGVETALQLRAFLDVPIVFLTAHSDASTLERAKHAQPSGFVLKPYDENDLRTAVEIGLFRYRAEREVRLSERWLGSTLDSIGDGVIATDREGKVRLLNGAAQNITGWSPVDAYGRDVEEILPLTSETSGQVVANPIREALSYNRIVHLEQFVQLRHKAGHQLPIDDSAAPIQDADGVSGAILVFRDISQRRALEKALEAQREQLLLANRQLQELNARKDFILGMVAHDLRNPLSIVLGYTSFLRTRLEGQIEDVDLKFLENIETSADFTLKLVEDLLDVAALESGQLSLKLRLVDLGELVPRVVTNNQPLFEAKKISVCADGGDIPLLARVDERKLEQVLINLLTNALKFSRPDTCVWVSAHKQGGEFHISVRDQGQGIAAEELRKLFQVFGTTSTRATGGEKSTGLGLAIAQKIVQGHGGRIEVESEAGIGSTFRVVLPIAH